MNVHMDGSNKQRNVLVAGKFPSLVVPVFADLVQPGKQQQALGRSALPGCPDPELGRTQALG